MENNKKKFINKKPAMTLAEILVVVAIVAIIGGIFLAMPKKNVSQMDKAKYYVAYSTLFKLLEAQLANTGSLQLNTAVAADADAGILAKADEFGASVEKYLNTVQSCNWSEDTSCDNPVPFNAEYNNAILTNGMYLDWGSQRNDSLNTPLTSPNSGTNLNDIADGKITRRAVYIDIDGLNEGRSASGQDVHYFLLYKDDDNDDIRVQPILETRNGGKHQTPGNIKSWIGFRVFRIDDNNGNTVVIRNDLDYVSAYGCYNKINAAYCNNECDRENPNIPKCFIEPIRPLK